MIIESIASGWHDVNINNIKDLTVGPLGTTITFIIPMEYKSKKKVRLYVNESIKEIEQMIENEKFNKEFEEKLK